MGRGRDGRARRDEDEEILKFGMRIWDLGKSLRSLRLSGKKPLIIDVFFFTAEAQRARGCGPDGAGIGGRKGRPT